MSKGLDRVAYLRGLADGMKLDAAKEENKLLLEALEVLKELADHIDEIDNKVEELADYTDEIGDNLDELNDTINDEMDIADKAEHTPAGVPLPPMGPLARKLLAARMMERIADELDADEECPCCAEDKEGKKSDKKKKKKKHNKD